MERVGKEQNEYNRKEIDRFLKHLANTNISLLRIVKYVYFLVKLSSLLGKAFSNASRSDLEMIVNKINKENYSEKTKEDYKVMIEVEPMNSTIDCSRCGNKVPKSLAVRMHRCGECGLAIDRDYNASLNILKKGLQLLELPMEHREVTPVEILMGSRKQEANALRHW